MKIETATVIRAPVEVVFDLLADIPAWPEVIPAITRIEVLNGDAIAVGTNFRETRVMFGREAHEVMTVAEMERPFRLVLTAENHGARYRAEHRLAPASEGARLALSFEGIPITFAARLFQPIGRLMLPRVRRMLEEDLDALRTVAEQRGRTGSP